MADKKIFRRDTLQTKTLERASRISSQNALRCTRALNLPVTFIENGTIIKELSDGKKVVLGSLTVSSAEVTVKKGMILHVKR